jgi:glycine/D-amino acid oxidase-like deaminating enzyme
VKRKSALHVLVAGAGAFGGWTALHLLRRGARVTLCDAWGPANPRASSGDDTRVIRATYGPDPIYVDYTLRSLPQWQELERSSRQLLFRNTGAIWLAMADDAWERAAAGYLREAGVRFNELSPADATRRYPAFDFSGVAWVLEEPDAGYLRARAGCSVVLARFLAEGGTYREVAVEPAPAGASPGDGVRLSDGSTVAADVYVFACGPWLGQLFPDLATRVRPTRQEVFYFGIPPRAEFRDGALPVWLDRGPGTFYSIPSGGRGIKLASDDRGEPFDPTAGDRTPTAAGLAAARAKLEQRLPGLRGAPVIEAKVCQYEQTPDSHFIVDRLPGAGHVWIAGGGSGHGFKHGPAVGELVAEAVLGLRKPEPQFLLSRFAR